MRSAERGAENDEGPNPDDECPFPSEIGIRQSEISGAAPESRSLGDFAKILSPSADAAPRIALGRDDISSGLGKLVLTLVELIRELLERQAIRRIEAGSLSEAEAERLGLAFLKLAGEVERLKKEFGLKDEDLSIDLGPLGRLL